MMNKEAKQQYMETLREKYFKGDKKEKGRLLDEYCGNTGQERKYVIKKFRYKVKLKKPGERKNRKENYDGQVRAVLAKMWEIFDYPCGQRLVTIHNLSCYNKKVINPLITAHYEKNIPK